MAAYMYEGEQTIPPGMTLSEYRRLQAAQKPQKRGLLSKLKRLI